MFLVCSGSGGVVGKKQACDTSHINIPFSWFQADLDIVLFPDQINF